MTLVELDARLPAETRQVLAHLRENPGLLWQHRYPIPLPSGILDQLSIDWTTGSLDPAILKEIIFLGTICGQFGFLAALLPMHREAIRSFVESLEPSARQLVVNSVYLAQDVNWQENPQGSGEAPFASETANLIWQLDYFDSLSQPSGHLMRIMAKYEPGTLLQILGRYPLYWNQIIEYPQIYNLGGIDARIDEKLAEAAFDILNRTTASSSCYSSEGTLRQRAFHILHHTIKLRKLPYLNEILRLASEPEFSSMNEGVEELLEHRKADVFALVSAGLGPFTPWASGPAHLELFRLAVENLAGEGEPFLKKILTMRRFKYGMAQEITKFLLADPATKHRERIRQIYLSYASPLIGRQLWEFWKDLAENDSGIFQPEWEAMAVGKSKPLRETAAAWLQVHRKETVQNDTETLLASQTVERRLAGIALLGASGTPDTIDRLTGLHATEPSKQARLAIAAILIKHGVSVAPEPVKQTEAIEDLAVFESSLAKKAKGIRCPKAAWLDFAVLPPLLSSSGRALSPLAVTYIFQHQARGNGGEIVPEVEVLLPHLNREANTSFSHALLDQWFNSPMKPQDRWALDVAGLTGDDTIIHRLTQPIASWCRQNQGSCAKWSVQAISLLGTEAALRTLDGLINRYRSERKYVGEAAAAAMFKTAMKLGIEEDELAERILPNCGFDSEGCRIFVLGEEKIVAALNPEFKIVWRRKDSATVSANPPSKLTGEAEEEWKEIRKSLKSAVPLLTSRLQNAMISGRRWDITVWRDRFEHHPLFRLAAMRLIWGVYDEEGILLRTFRLYPNSLTAAADGSLEEFSQPAATIGVVHPLELESNEIEKWRAHLIRFKVGPLFRQVDRPVHRLNVLHGNRQQLQITDQISVKAGSLRGHFLGKGWSLGTSGQGGYIHCLFRHFPACGLHAYLPVQELHAASTLDDEVRTHSAFFARIEAGKQATRDQFMEAEALNFREVPPLVYSEILEDLTSFITTK